MDNQFKSFSEISFDEYEIPQYFNPNNQERFKTCKIRLLEVHRLLNKSIGIIKTSEIPFSLVQQFKGIVEEFEELAKNLLLTGIPKERSNPDQVFIKIERFHTDFFEASNSRMLLVINAISNYSGFLDSELIERLEAVDEVIEDRKKQIDNILSILAKPSADRVLSDYATIYRNEEIRSDKISRNWLLTGLGAVIIFAALLMLSTYFNWFSPKLTLENTVDGVRNIREIINIPVLLTKIVLVSIFAFFIVFCFRQYSIYKHLAFVNQQRKTAFDSYLLFHAAIGEKDTEATKSLLMSLAKTIHETINSGFLSSKGLNQPLVQNIDLGKIQS